MSAVSVGRTDEADLVILELVRLITVDTWNVDVAAACLHRKRHSRGALQVALSRVCRARAERPTRITDRATATLSTAIARLDINRQPAIGIATCTPSSGSVFGLGTTAR